MIYFVTAREIGRVKIGFSDEPRSRFVKMRTDSPVPLALERICDGTMADERAMHQRFASDRLAGEWFTLSAAIESHMDSIPPLPVKSKSINQLIIEHCQCSPGLASQWLRGDRPLPMSAAVAVYNATGRCIGPMEHAEPHEAATLAKFIKPWTPVSERGAA